MKINEDTKIIFLDIDGVLNNTLCVAYPQLLNPGETAQNRLKYFDKRCVDCLNELISHTDAKIVVSSTWRFGRSIEGLRQLFKFNGVKGEVIDKTPRLQSGLRGNEIYEWMQNNVDKYYEYKNYVILDDDSDMLYWQKDNFIIVDPFCGLTPRIIYKAEQILNINNKNKG